jgi:hypothetical protein
MHLFTLSLLYLYSHIIAFSTPNPVVFDTYKVNLMSFRISVLLESTGWIYLLRHLPWLAGSLGCCFFDMLMIGQVYYYASRNLAASGGAGDEREGLLLEEDEMAEE